MTPEVEHKIYSKEIADKRQILLDGSPEDRPVPAQCHMHVREATTAPTGTRLKLEIHVELPATIDGEEERKLCIPMPFAMSYARLPMPVPDPETGEPVMALVQVPTGMTPEFRLEMN